MQDTFFHSNNPDILLRTHTSSVQSVLHGKIQTANRTISPGRVFRNEAVSSRSHCIFHQVEGLYIDKDVFCRQNKRFIYLPKRCLENQNPFASILLRLRNQVLRLIFIGV
jgi:phenylalanyl-tRNA synthetase alpha chain